jgi:hypothetical protein
MIASNGALGPTISLNSARESPAGSIIAQI